MPFLKKGLAALVLLSAANACYAAPDFITWDQTTLAAVKAHLAEHQTPYTAALAELQKAADKALTHSPYSVVQKQLTPASGDKHDYYSFGPYWWPNPKSADQMPYIRKDGQINPQAKTDATDSKRMVNFANDVRALSLAWYYTGQADYAHKAAELVKAWFVTPTTRMNPTLAYAQAIPGQVPGRGIGIIDGRVLIDVMDSVGLLHATKQIDEADYRAIQEWYRQFEGWLLTSQNGEEESNWHNNHGAFYDDQVVAYAIFTNQPDLARHQLHIAELRHLAAQIDNRGYLTAELERTRSWHYTNFALSAYVRLARYGELVGMDVWNFELDNHTLKQALLRVAEQTGQPANHWGWQELRYEEASAVGNLVAAQRHWPEAPFQQKVDYLAAHYPADINFLMPGASLVP